MLTFFFLIIVFHRFFFNHAHNPSHGVMSVTTKDDSIGSSVLKFVGYKHTNKCRQIYQVYLYICIDKNTQLFHNYYQQRKLAQQNNLWPKLVLFYHHNLCKNFCFTKIFVKDLSLCLKLKIYNPFYLCNL